MCVGKCFFLHFLSVFSSTQTVFKFLFQSHTVCVNNLLVWRQCRQLLSWIPQQPTSSTTQTSPSPHLSGLSCRVSFTVMQRCTKTLPVDFPPLDLAPYPCQQWNITSPCQCIFHSAHRSVAVPPGTSTPIAAGWVFPSVFVLSIVLYLIMSFDWAPRSMDVHLGMQECGSVRRGVDYVFVERVSKGYFTHGKKRASDRWVAGMSDNEFLPGLAVCVDRWHHPFEKSWRI